jgi:hypothetical protein
MFYSVLTGGRDRRLGLESSAAEKRCRRDGKGYRLPNLRDSTLFYSNEAVEEVRGDRRGRGCVDHGVSMSNVPQCFRVIEGNEQFLSRLQERSGRVMETTQDKLR